jgi:hypothetical protein
MARQGKALKVRQDKSSKGKARQLKERLGKASQG